MPLADVLMVEGLHVPVILLVDVVGSVGAVDPWHSGPICVNVGVIDALTVTCIVTGTAHPDGVKVYPVVPVADVLIVDGFHIPLIPFIDIGGSVGGVEFKHNIPIDGKFGVTCGATVMLNVVLTAHCPAAGVKVYTVVAAIAVFTVEGFHVPVIPSLDVKISVGGGEF